MKSWFGILGRSCLEFLLLLALLALISGASASYAASATNGVSLLAYSVAYLPRSIPLAVAATMFLAMFSFERCVESRALGWLGAILVGALLLGAGLASRRVPLLRDLAPAEPKAAVGISLQPPGYARDRGGLFFWYRDAAGPTVDDAVVVDFRAPFPRLSYAAQAPLDAARGTVELGGSRYDAALPSRSAKPLLPEVEFIPGPPIWERFAALDRGPLGMAAAMLGAFVLLAAGFRFLARLTLWPLANALFAVAGFLAFLCLDAALWSPAAASFGQGLAGRAGLASAAAFLPAAVEGLLGLALGAIDLAIKPSERPIRG